MIPCISVETMRLSDAYTIANFVPGLELMYRAAMGVFKAHHWQGTTAIVVGSGNNGGDGFALAWILKEKGFDCAVFTLSQKLSSDSAYYAEKAKQLEEEKKAAEEKARLEREANPTTEELLKQIRDLLQQKAE